MIPTYLFIMWMCASTNTTCPIWESSRHMVLIEPEADRRACEAVWAETNAIPDPDGLHSLHRCQPISESL